MPTHAHRTEVKRLLRLREEAARWFVRMRSSEPDHPDRGRFEAWLLGNPAHAREYAAIASVWEDFDSTRQLQSLAQAMQQKKTEATGNAKLRKFASHNLFGILILVISCLAGVPMWQSWVSQPVYQLAENTGIGQIGHQTLVDGTRLVLNANARVKVAYYRDRRTVDIDQGEVIFDVTKDPSRPFVVDSGHARITVLGTRFAVNRLANLVRVSVDHGSVKVEAQQDRKAHAMEPYVVLHDGEVAEVNIGEFPHRVQRRAADAFTFPRGVLTFRQAYLSEIAETLSRYRASPVTTSATDRFSTQVTAVVQVADMESFIQALPKIAPVSLRQMDGETRLVNSQRSR